MGKKQNFLFLFSDQHRGDWMPCDVRNGPFLRLPSLCSLMENGTTFTSAVTPAPLCAPARACLASGRRYRHCRVYTNGENYDACLPSFYAALRSAGYFVGGAGKFDLNKAELDWGDGFHEILHRLGFSQARDNEGKIDSVLAADAGMPGPYAQMLKNAGWLETYCQDMRKRKHSDRTTPLPDEFYADNWITGQSLEILRSIPQDMPWFMQVNFSGPHDPWDVTARMKQSVQDRQYPQAVGNTDQEKNQRIRQNYAAMIENIDRNIGILLEEVHRRGDWGNTIIIYSADHGEMMGDWDLYGKSVPWQGAIHIPLVIDASCRGGQIGQLNNSPVELQDLAATVLEYAGVDATPFRESMSLRPIIEGYKHAVRKIAISELLTAQKENPLNAFTAVTDGRYKYVAYSDGKSWLFDLAQDPLEQHDIQEEHPDVVRALKAYW